MTEVEYSQASEATELCLACGLCCTGHLFSWVRLKAVELTPLEKLGLNVIRNDPRQRGFAQPCPMWNGKCTIYNSPHYPRGCNSYKCKLLRELLDESVSLPKALRTVKRAKEKIKVVEKYLPASKSVSFRERMVKRLERINSSASLDARDAGFQSKAAELLYYFDKQFGVNDFLVLQETL
jgi:hypothetical protein